MEQYKSLLCMKEPPITKCIFNNNSNKRIITAIRNGLFKNDCVLSTKFRSHRHNEQHKKHSDNIYMQHHNIFLTTTPIYNLTKTKITTTTAMNSNVSENDTCCICQLPYHVDEYYTTLPCLHVFHYNCMQMWIKYKKYICPICKVYI